MIDLRIARKQGKLASLKQQAQVQLAKLGGNPDVPTTEHPQYLQIQAQVDEAQRQLDHTTVVAVARKLVGLANDVEPVQDGRNRSLPSAPRHAPAKAWLGPSATLSRFCVMRVA